MLIAGLVIESIFLSFQYLRRELDVLAVGFIPYGFCPTGGLRSWRVNLDLRIDDIPEDLLGLFGRLGHCISCS